MTLKRIVKTLGLSALLGFVVTPICAQDLIARQSPVDRRAKSLDTMVINRLQEAEEVENPSSMLQRLEQFTNTCTRIFARSL